MSSITVDVSELVALDHRLAGAGPVLQKHLVHGVDRAGKLMEGAAKRNAPVQTGTLRRSITSTASAIAGGAQAVIAPATPYARAVEEGRRGFGPVNARALRFVIDGRVIFAMHVGPAKGQWYMRRAFRDNRTGAIRIVQQAGREAADEILGVAA